MKKELIKLPRLYTNQPLMAGQPIMLSPAHTHYFRSVLRRQEDDLFRVFNGRDGEFTAQITALGKKDGQAQIQEKIREQPLHTPEIHLIFAPIKKQRLDILIEKAVELGVGALHPVVTARTENRKLNEERLQAQTIEAAEQCERLTIPVLHPLTPLATKLTAWRSPAPLYWCRERTDAKPLKGLNLQNAAFLVGPEGGFNEHETALLEQNSGVMPISLGKTVYRSETACIICLSAAMLCQNQDP
jgi:16S rRNA (uracil1498-N3)-methyltransferase